jgi:predicted dehydrogenase
MAKIKWGIIGCGNIANKFASDLSLIKEADLVAVASRSSEKAESFKIKHKAKCAYGNYDLLLKDADIDIVYIATPHISHAELSIQAMRHGKHVLCEKPLALNFEEANAIIKTARQHNCFFMEALWTRFNPSLIAIKKIIDNGEIGDIKYINADFAFKSTKSLTSRVMNLKLGGGAILDIGLYPAFLAYVFLGMPKSIVAKSTFHETTHCDIQSSMIFDYSKAQALLYCGFTSRSDRKATISGTEGQIHIDYPWHHTQGFTLISNNKEQKFNLPTIGIGYSHEIIECHDCINKNKIESLLWSHQNSLELISILDKVRKQVGLKYPQE